MRFPVEKSLPLIAIALLAACGGGVRGDLAAQVPVAANGPEADYPMVLGEPFAVDGVTYTPVDKMNYDAVGYADASPDGGTAVSGAHRTLPLPSYVEVTALDSGKTILVRIERRGPMTGKGLVELSPGAAAQLGVAGKANAPVRVRRVNPIEPDRAALRSGRSAPDRIETPKSLLAVLQRKLDAQDGVVRPVVTTDPEEPGMASLPPKPEAKPKDKPKPAAKPAASAQVQKPAVRPATPAKDPAIAKAPVPTKPAAVAKAATATGKYFIQVGAFSSKANADASARKVGGSANQTGKLWRVRTGPFATEGEAKAALAKARGAGYSDARIQRAD